MCAVIKVAYWKETLRIINNQGACRLKTTPELVLIAVAINFFWVFLLVCFLQMQVGRYRQHDED